MVSLRSISDERKLSKDYYRYEVDKFISFLKVKLEIYQLIDRQVVEEYLRDLEVVADAYESAIQNVELVERDEFELLDMDPPGYKDFNYEYSKVLVDCARGTDAQDYDRDPWANRCLEILIEKELLPKYAVELSRSELDLLIHAYSYEFSKKHF